MEDTYSNSYTEILEILKEIPKSELEKIPQKEIDFFEQNKNKDYKYVYDSQNPKTLRKTDALIVYLYKKYIADVDESKMIDERLKQNYIRNEEEKRKKFSVDVFKEQDVLIKMPEINMTENEETSLVELKESFWTRLINRIKNIFK